MTEKEKMLNGEYYDSRDPELLTMYHRARRLLKASERIIEPGDRSRHLTSTKPVTIGDNLTIGAGSVVTKNISGNVLAFGNPCEVKRILE